VRLLENFNIINATQETPHIMTSLKLKYEKKGLQLSLSDLIIASLAVENDTALATPDSDFKRTEELNLYFI
jgi:predicted nucleic acid-binding protein